MSALQHKLHKIGSTENSFACFKHSRLIGIILSKNNRFTLLVLKPESREDRLYTMYLVCIVWCISSHGTDNVRMTKYLFHDKRYLQHVLLQYPQMNSIWMLCLVSKSAGTETINYMSTPLKPPTLSLCMSTRCLVVNRADIKCTTVYAISPHWW